ncbi:MAG TPA: permease [Solirubrobacteraceae bacterium]|nr:permease [Solirubrobacteraceae bacterium]
MTSVLNSIGEGLSNAFLMAWNIWWALVLGFTISGIVQAWVPPDRVERSLGGSGVRAVTLATGLGAASSSCSYAAVAIARALFAAGASAATTLAFQFASTNLVVELGIVLWLLIGWQFTLAELVGGVVLVAITTMLLRLFVSARLEAQARDHARAADPGHQHRSAGASISIRPRLTSVEAWSDVAHNFRNDWAMVYRDILVGLLLAGFVGLLGNGFLGELFARQAPEALRLAENVLVGPLLAVLSFVCSIGNVPLAAVLWSGGIGFAGVIAFIFADLIILPIVAIYRKCYGRRFAARIVALMLVAMILAALIVDGLFSVAGLIPHARPTRARIFSGVTVDYRLFANILGVAVFAVLFALTTRRRSADGFEPHTHACGAPSTETPPREAGP